jgi:hypothetical protein
MNMSTATTGTVRISLGLAIPARTDVQALTQYADELDMGAHAL